MTGEKVSLLEVQARWGYSEIIDSNFTTDYDNQLFMPICQQLKLHLDALRIKRRSRLPFEGLSAEDRYWLAFMCWPVRPNLMVLMAGIDRFCEVELAKARLAKLLVPPMVSNILRFMPFDEYVVTPCSSPKDARNVTATPGSYEHPPDAVTVGRFHDSQVLLDGYHRAAAFWKFAPSDASIRSYLPD
jgi:hypothetical protein